MFKQWDHKIVTLKKEDFEATALEVFRFQYKENQIYKEYADALHIKASDVKAIEQVPFLPIRFFKTHQVKTCDFEPETVFESSGTTRTISSKHFVKDVSLYEQSFKNGFELFYGSIKDWCILGLLPSYLERDNSSLIYMVDKLMKENGHPQNGFFLNDFEKLRSTLSELESKKQKTLLIGVTFALLDFAKDFPQPLQHIIIMETGGMKGRREEMIRQEVHQELKNAFSVSSIHSEYGMTELLSQAYSKQDGIFYCPPWMKVMVRDEEDPFTLSDQQTGVINIIDLANIHSCSFIATDDAGKIYKDGSFEILGRIDNSDIRGCSLLAL